MLKTNSSLRVGLAAALAVFTIAFAGTSSVAALRSTEEVNRLLRNGVASAVQWDNVECTSALVQNTMMGYSYRQAVNGVPGVTPSTAAYRSDFWISPRNSANIINPTPVASGASTIPLQLNRVLFVCATLVDPLVPSPVSANVIHDDRSRWVTNTGNANDRRPLTLRESRDMGIAQTRTEYEIINREVLSDSEVKGSIVGINPGTRLAINADYSTRYWLVDPTPFDFQPSSAIVGQKTLKIRVHYKNIDSFSTNDHKCINARTGQVMQTTQGGFGPCTVYATDILLRLVAPEARWNVDSKSQVRKLGGSWSDRVTANPGETVEFRHSLTNRADSKEPAYGFEWSIGWGDHDRGEEVDRGGISAGNPLRIGETRYLRDSNVYRYTVPANPPIYPGRDNFEYCRSIEGYVVSSLDMGNPGTGKSNNACVVVGKPTPPPPVATIRTDYMGAHGEPIVPGDHAPWRHRFTDTTYRKYDGPGSSWNRSDIKTGDYFESIDMTFYQDPNADVITGVPSKKISNYGSTSYTGNTGYYPKESDIGQRICHWFSYVINYRTYSVASRQRVIGSREYTDAFGNIRTEPIYRTEYYPTSTPGKTSPRESNRDQCVEIGTKPKLQVWGGDLRVGGQVQTSLMRPAYRGSGTHPWYGSWSEYGLLAGGRVVEGAKSGMASASALNGGDSAKGLGSTSPTPWSNLTFTNSSSQKGNFAGAIGGHDSLLNQFRSMRTTPGFAGINAGQSGVFAVGSISLSGNLRAGQSLILISSGTVTIDGNIIYPGSYANTGSIPQLVIVANAINIRENVGNVDAWLLTSGALNTCSNYASSALRLDRCSGRLQINGPIVANSLILNRTYGSRAGSSEQPAETFNYRADAAIWAREYAGSSNKIQTVDIREVPARF